MTKRYLVVYAKAPDSNFSGMSPDVLGCVSTGNDLQTMRAMMTEALAFHIEGLVGDGDAVPEPHTTSVDFTDQDFEDVEYFVVEHLEVSVHQLSAQRAVSAA